MQITWTNCADKMPPSTMERAKMNEQILRIMTIFNNLPNTNEKAAIQSRYLKSKTSAYEFHSEALAYIKKVNKGEHSES